MKVMIRMFKGEPIAIFPYEFESYNTVLSYAHIGQHSGAYCHLVGETKKCPEPEAEELLNELKTIGYNDLQVIKRRDMNEFTKAHNEFLKNQTL